jgi:hypothetical protein
MRFVSYQKKVRHYFIPELLVKYNYLFRLPSLFFDTENGGNTFLRNVGNLYKTTKRHNPKDSTFPNPGLFSFTFASVKGENRHLTLCIKYLKYCSAPNVQADGSGVTIYMKLSIFKTNDNENIKLVKLFTMEIHFENLNLRSFHDFPRSS